MAFAETCRCPYCLPWRWCTGETSLPSSPARSCSWDPYRRIGGLPPYSPWSPAYWVRVKNLSFLVLVFRQRKSMQKQSVPSFILTSMMMLHHDKWEGQMAPPSIISWMCFWTSSTTGWAICLNLSLKGSSSVSSIVCSLAFIQPISLGSSKKI